MIAHIKGIIAEKFNSSVIVDVSGVGYELALTTLDYDEVNLNDEKKFYTYHKVAETAEELYGFSTLAAKKIFELLISVNGVGPKAGMAILSLGTPEEVRNAIANGDVSFISKAAGVGKKSAERVIVDLRDKVGLPSKYGTAEIVGAPKVSENDEALDALMALGFSLKDATDALSGIDENLPTEERIKQALKSK
ncbi:Holliday junction branch migration protein RuvA [Candidatus Saccharibacteria bacterium]|nr:Holliday junction branch migration protein RuvA [Candidatus Saccharibacteria bacterium]